MSTLPPPAATHQAGPASAELLALVMAATEAAAGRMPTAFPLAAGEPVPAGETPVLPASASGAVCARLGTLGEGEIIVVVADDVVEALAESPLGALELAPALQPALDAAAAVFGGTPAEAGRQIDPAVVLDPTRGYVVVPLFADGEHRATIAIRPPQAGAGGNRPSPTPAARARGIELLRDVEMEVTVELGRTRMTVRELLTLAPGAVVELDRAASSPADVLVNGTLIARGEVVVVDEDFGIRITEIVASPTPESAR